MNIRDELNFFDCFNDLRFRFLNRIAETHLRHNAGGPRPCLIIVTHLLPDRPALLTVLDRYCDIAHVFAIPYSTNRAVAVWATDKFRVSEPPLHELLEGRCIERELLSSHGSQIILLDIGGYAAPVINRISEMQGGQLAGVVEGTQSGLHRYSRVALGSLPVICMSLSPMKTAESALVGPACFFSVERILRAIGFTNELKTAAVLGYGRIGKSVAEAFRSRGLLVYVFDKEPERCVQALADGFLIPERATALARADLVLGATGQRSWYIEDAQVMRDGVFMASCSSKDDEFDFSAVRRRFPVAELGANVHTAVIAGKRVHFIYEGQPVNFSDGANLGPLLPLIQAETIAACGDLLRRRFTGGVQQPNQDTMRDVIKEWFAYYLDLDLGWYKQRSVI